MRARLRRAGQQVSRVSPWLKASPILADRPFAPRDLNQIATNETIGPRQRLRAPRKRMQTPAAGDHQPRAEAAIARRHAPLDQFLGKSTTVSFTRLNRFVKVMSAIASSVSTIC